MKPSTAILYVIVTLSFVFSLVALLIVAQNSDISVPTSPTAPPEWTNTMPTYTPPDVSPPKPTTSPFDTVLVVKYTETNRVESDGKTKVTIAVDVTYKSGDAISIKYSDLYLHLYMSRSIYYVTMGTAAPKNSGSFTMSSSHRAQTIQLSFEFVTQFDNGVDSGTALYQLEYNGDATIQWSSRANIY